MIQTVREVIFERFLRATVPGIVTAGIATARCSRVGRRVPGAAIAAIATTSATADSCAAATDHWRSVSLRPTVVRQHRHAVADVDVGAR